LKVRRPSLTQEITDLASSKNREVSFDARAYAAHYGLRFKKRGWKTERAKRRNVSVEIIYDMYGITILVIRGKKLVDVIISKGDMCGGNAEGATYRATLNWVTKIQK